MIKNKINGKIYVGQTIRNYNKRHKEHIRELNHKRHHNNHLQRAWNKYGEENFEFILLHEIEFDTEENRRKMLDLIECMYIAGWRLLDINYGYNIAEGGSNGNTFAGKTEEEYNELCDSKRGKNHWSYGIGKKIAKIDINTNSIIKIYNCTSDASEEVCGDRRNKNILCCARGKSYSAWGYKWRFIDGDNNIIHTDYDYNKIIKIAMIDKSNHNIIKVFNSISDAEEYISGNRRGRGVRSCLTGVYKTAYGYKWRYLDDDNNIVFFENDEPILDRRIAMIDKKTNEILKIFNTVPDANIFLGIDRDNESIYGCLNGHNNTSFNYKWSYIDDNGDININKEPVLDKKVIMIDKDTNEILMKFDNCECAKAYLELILNKKLYTNTINGCANGKTKTAYGYKWEYIYE